MWCNSFSVGQDYAKNKHVRFSFLSFEQSTEEINWAQQLIIFI